MLLALALQVPPPPVPESDVVVIGRKLDDWRSKLTFEKGRTTCITKVSTGDAEIDAIGCTAMSECFTKTLPAFDASQSKGLSRDERKRLMAVAEQAMKACLMPMRDELVQALADQRLAARAAGGRTQ